MIHISNAIRDGAEVFFNTQYGSISKMALLLALLIFVIYIFRPQQDSLSLGSFTTASITVLSFLLGAVCSDSLVDLLWLLLVGLFSVLLSSLPHSMFAWESTHLAPSRLLISPPCLPDLSPQENFSVLGSMQLGKYTEWFNDVFSPEISTMCEDILNLLLETHGCKVVEVVIPELRQLRTSHLLPVGSESLASLTPRCHDRNGIESAVSITGSEIFTYSIKTQAEQKISCMVMDHGNNKYVQGVPDLKEGTAKHKNDELPITRKVAWFQERLKYYCIELNLAPVIGIVAWVFLTVLDISLLLTTGFIKLVRPSPPILLLE
ncbi:fatty acid amide hydrolase isoform X1 [Tanacetum coccineum]